MAKLTKCPDHLRFRSLRDFGDAIDNATLPTDNILLSWGGRHSLVVKVSRTRDCGWRLTFIDAPDSIRPERFVAFMQRRFKGWDGASLVTAKSVAGNPKATGLKRWTEHTVIVD
jgi:hypothetical protein